ncbi:hypothetical protein [Shewanella sp. Isolate7]|uniref:AbiTii domain-containing protein n=1 Tax=Shewanella sp. Isolate7 TaxID=2908528 RepID=UPI001EFDFA98|nr:hypothetical protein [Shewanella sp. Isolate7]MCG9722117.1 hypothetical protein [Shewanella sp. Isolate7]
MDSIVLELQRECLDESVPLKSLARKALLIIQKLNLNEAWLQHELNGYKGEQLPDYRNLAGMIMAKFPRQGYLPIELPQELENEMTSYPMSLSIAELESTLSFAGDSAYIPLPTDMQRSLRDLYSHEVEFHFRVPLSRIHGLLDLIRSRILDFTVQLERKNILGSGMAFNPQEKQKAQTMTITVNGNFQGILGNVSQSEVTQTFNNGIQGDLEALVEALKQNHVADADINELKSAITIDGEVVTKTDDFGPAVTSWIKGMFNKAIEGSWQVGIATAGNVLGTALNGYYLG